MKYGFLNIKDRVMMVNDASNGPGSAHAPGAVMVSSFALEAGLPDMNVTLNYENPTNNSIALVAKALMANEIYNMNDPESGMTDEQIAEINDILYNPGYAPMERLVKAFVRFKGPHTIDPYNIQEESKTNYVIDFANDWERLAFVICPDMFMKPATTTSGDDTVAVNPGGEASGPNQ